MSCIKKLSTQSLRTGSALLVMLAAMPAHSATSTGAVAISANVPAVCAVTGAAIAFGNYASSQLDQSASIGVLCTHGTTYSIGMDAGSGSGATIASRVMTGPSGAMLNYTLYGDSGHTTVWGQTAGNTMPGTGNGLLQSLNVYGRIPGSQTPETGVYSDSVTVTLTY